MLSPLRFQGYSYSAAACPNVPATKSLSGMSDLMQIDLVFTRLSGQQLRDFDEAVANMKGRKGPELFQAIGLDQLFQLPIHALDQQMIVEQVVKYGTADQMVKLSELMVRAAKYDYDGPCHKRYSFNMNRDITFYTLSNLMDSPDPVVRRNVMKAVQFHDDSFMSSGLRLHLTNRGEADMDEEVRTQAREIKSGMNLPSAENSLAVYQGFYTRR